MWIESTLMDKSQAECLVLGDCCCFLPNTWLNDEGKSDMPVNLFD